jgi:hypothetical protein
MVDVDFSPFEIEVRTRHGDLVRADVYLARHQGRIAQHILLARQKGRVAYVGEGKNRLPAVHTPSGFTGWSSKRAKRARATTP